MEPPPSLSDTRDRRCFIPPLSPAFVEECPPSDPLPPEAYYRNDSPSPPRSEIDDPDFVAPSPADSTYARNLTYSILEDEIERARYLTPEQSDDEGYGLRPLEELEQTVMQWELEAQADEYLQYEEAEMAMYIDEA